MRSTIGTLSTVSYESPVPLKTIGIATWLWIHGHTHESFDYEIGKTRVICNPRGYAPIEINKEFKPDFNVEV